MTTTATAPIVEGPMIAPIEFPIPGRDGQVVTVSMYRYADRFVYTINVNRGSWGRDSMPDALAIVEGAIAWEVRVLRHCTDGHESPYVAGCVDCQIVDEAALVAVAAGR